MEKEFVPYDIALVLKELGFDEPYLAFYRKSTSNLFITEGFSFNTLEDTHFVKAPLYQQAFRWFREKYNLVIEPCVPFQRLYSTEDDHFEILEFGYRIYSFDQYRGGLRDKIEWDGYDNSNEEEAELECLKKLIEIIKK